MWSPGRPGRPNVSRRDYRAGQVARCLLGDCRADRVGRCRRADCPAVPDDQYQRVDCPVDPDGRCRPVDCRVDQDVQHRVLHRQCHRHRRCRPGSQAACSRYFPVQPGRLLPEAHCSDDCLKTLQPRRRPAHHRSQPPRYRGRLMAGRRRHSRHPHSADQESFAHRVSMVVRRLLVVIRRSIPHPAPGRVPAFGRLATLPAGPIARVRPIGNVASARPISGPCTRAIARRGQVTHRWPIICNLAATRSSNVRSRWPRHRRSTGSNIARSATATPRCTTARTRATSTARSATTA